MPNGPKNIALCLSGGGFRATFFHLGTIKALQRSNLLGRVSHIFSVSGGSIVAAHLVLNWSKYCGDSNAFAKVVRHLYKFGKRDVRGRVVRRWILTCNLPRKLSKYGLGPTDHLEREYRGLFSNKSFADIESGAPKLYVLATNLITGQLTSFSKDGYAIEDQVNTLLDSNYIPLSLAVTASSAFPPMFPPVRVTPESLKVPHESFTAPILPSPHLLTDGGVYDNLGFEKAALMMQRGELPADLMILVSDAGGPLLTNIRDEFSWPISRGVRTADLLMNLVAENTLSKAKRRCPA
jgi:predicted acylesterase/phospholipase RssA